MQVSKGRRTRLRKVIQTRTKEQKREIAESPIVVVKVCC